MWKQNMFAYSVWYLGLFSYKQPHLSVPIPTYPHSSFSILYTDTQNKEKTTFSILSLSPLPYMIQYNTIQPTTVTDKLWVVPLLSLQFHSSSLSFMSNSNWSQTTSPIVSQSIFWLMKPPLSFCFCHWNKSTQ